MSATTNCLNGSLLTLIIIIICAITLFGKQCRINNSESESESEIFCHVNFISSIRVHIVFQQHCVVIIICAMAIITR